MSERLTTSEVSSIVPDFKIFLYGSSCNYPFSASFSLIYWYPPSKDGEPRKNKETAKEQEWDPKKERITVLEMPHTEIVQSGFIWPASRFQIKK